ncbi:hypothetical protein ACFPYI_05705 [Halomarina salina]|uniref:Uncharacterized protein n=1 Tax=Halomarina salina TaxID=1872699 RepID=A0ABD5RKC6_9EURY|nr:hypothetical protein [Halomarina salina]
MADLRREVVDEAGSRSKYLTATEFLTLVERGHPTDGPGVERETFDAYTERLGEESPAVDGESFQTSLDDRVSDSEEWVDDETVYRLGDGRVSLYPASWHEQLGGVSDPKAYLETFSETGAFERGVPESTLLEAMAAVGGVDRETAKGNLEALRERDEIVEDADQHPEANVYLAEERPDIDEAKDV